ncbi:QsdR family transcriptional regulator [Amycolatopsis sp. NBC_01480]|uniref:QsdR family transcriptional regulator n=1 Tax=Amycolatopsis sp. NBC_01480 TaxID=2903562 RepID=UPI002E2D9FFB|nr:QsdR family transcriptional regulator [Amycolatopsis sp. NBC_01480]
MPTSKPNSRTSGRQRAQPADAYALARRKYLAGQRIDLGQLAEELGVNRVTLYRWVGSRDVLLVEVIWRLTEETLTREWEKLANVRGPRVPRMLGAYLRDTMSQPGARHFLVTENERAMRLFTLASHGFQPRFLAAVRYYLSLDIETGRISSPLAVDDLAYVTVRIAESYQYLPTIAGAAPDPDTAERVLTALLRA